MGLLQDWADKAGEAITGQRGAHVNLPFSGTGATPEGVDVSKNINPNLKSAVDQQSQMGNMSQEDIANRSMQGVQERGQSSLATPQNLAQGSMGLGGNQDAGMQQALSNRTNKMFESHINDLSQIAKMNAPHIQAEQQAQALQAQAHQEQMMNYMINAQAVKAQNEQAQKNAVLNSILGLGGAIAGAAIAGPGGAMAGAQAGSALGGMAGKTVGGPIDQIQALDTSGQGAMNYFGGGK